MTESRYKHAPLVTNRGSAGALVEPIHYGIRPFLAELNFPDNAHIELAEGTTPHYLAWKAYGTSDLYWVILEASGVDDPFTGLLPDDGMFYVGGLLVDLASGPVTSLRLSNTRKVSRGDTLCVESLAPGAPTSFNVVVREVRSDGEVVVSPRIISTPVPTTYSRVMRLERTPKEVVLPSLARVQFDLLDYGNPLATLSTE